MYIYLYLCIYIYLPIYLSTYLSIYLYIYIYIYKKKNSIVRKATTPFLSERSSDLTRKQRPSGSQVSSEWTLSIGRVCFAMFIIYTMKRKVLFLRFICRKKLQVYFKLIGALV